MIRCIPVDGSAPFEVPNQYRYDGTLLELCLDELSQAWINERLCRIESWRERAERLEKELEALRRQNALDAIDKRRESEHG